MDWWQHIIFPISRWLHMVSFTLLVGGTMFYELVVPIAIEDLRKEQQLYVFARARWVFRWIVYISVVLLTITGLVSMYRLWGTYTDPRYSPSLWVALGHGKTKDTAAFQKALDEAAKSKAIVLVPKGDYHVGALFVRSNTELRLETGATLLGSPDGADYPVVKSRWEGVERQVHASLINAFDATDIALTGPGTIDGRGKTWWDRFRGKGPKLNFPRPRLVEIVNCTNIHMEDLTLKDSASWTIHPVYCDKATFTRLTVLAPPDSPNTDGIDPDSSTNITISHCKFDCGDDCVAIKSGRDADGRRVGKPSANILVENCLMLHGHGGVVVGSEMSGGVKNVLARNCVFDGTKRGIRLKTTRGRGGTVEDVTFENITLRNIPEDAISINMYYNTKPDGTTRPVTEATPTFRNVTLRNITIESAQSAGSIHGLPESPITNLLLQNVTIKATKGLDIRYATDTTFKDVSVTAEEGPSITKTSVEGKGL